MPTPLHKHKKAHLNFRKQVEVERVNQVLNSIAEELKKKEEKAKEAEPPVGERLGGSINPILTNERMV